MPMKGVVKWSFQTLDKQLRNRGWGQSPPPIAVMFYVTVFYFKIWNIDSCVVYSLKHSSNVLYNVALDFEDYL